MSKSYIKTKRDGLACDLIDQLKSIGVVASVGYDSKRGPIALRVLLQHSSDSERVPKTFEGYPVSIVEV